MKLLIVSLFSFVFLAACGITPRDRSAAVAGAIGATATAEEIEAAAEGEDPDIVCVSAAVTGSRIPEYQCSTRAERKELKENAERFIRRGQQTFGTPGS